MMFARLAVLIAVVIVVDFVDFVGLKVMLRRLKNTNFYNRLFVVYWAMDVLMALYFMIHFLWVGYPGDDYKKYRSFFFVFGVFLLVYLPRFVYFLFVVGQLIYYKLKLLFKPKRNYSVNRKKRNNYIIQKVGLLFAGLMFFLVLYGMIWGKDNFVVKQETIYFSDLPISFDGLRIAQLSDMHLGSFTSTAEVEKGVDLLRKQNPDLILFTGDMVNNVAAELDDYKKLFANIHPKYGMYAILGNHDMGDYVKWKDTKIQLSKIQQIIDAEEDMGFVMMLNQNKILYKGDDSIAIIGVENWGKPPFKKYGDLHLAMRGVENVPFKILLTHDPSHFDLEVKEKTPIQLTLSGHTHGMQMGIDCCGFKWSPIQWLYPEWDGLYRFGRQYIYVNPGFGYIGMPLRIGISPEITIITLKRASHE